MDKQNLTVSSCCSSVITERNRPSCCADDESRFNRMLGRAEAPWVVDTIGTSAGWVPRVTSILSLHDRWGTLKVRLGIGRMRYRVAPGLYAVGNPTAESLVMVSANFKLSFDRLRSNLNGIDAWILVLDTKGINVWCAAGKGTFGTDEIVQRTQAVGLDQIVTHRQLLLPQLGAPGVRAHEVLRRSGFQVVYGPVRSEDIPAFLETGMKATPQMRRVRFSISDRALLIPTDIVGGMKYALPIAAGFLILSGLYSWGYSLDLLRTVGIRSLLLLAGIYLAGTAITPILLPWIPGRAFAAKGAWIGLIVSVALVCLMQGNLGTSIGWLGVVSWMLMGMSLSSFIAMNFTGSSTFTSLSGVRKEMKTAVPLQIIGAGVGFIVWLVARFV